MHSIIGSGDGRRLYVGGGGSGARRLRPSNHQQENNGQPALRCPRCESLNTKFCYYNNYNLSQPRHFCKSCRRYWTKGGVLRNVPVGGGCRKKKRSKHKPSNRNRSCNAGVRKPSNSQNSSSDSSSLTATTTAANTSTATATETTTTPITASEVLSGANSVPALLQFQEASTGFLNPSFDPPLLDHTSALFPEMETLTSLITTHLPLEFNISAGVSPFRLHHADRIVESSIPDEQQWMLTDDTIGDDLKVPTEFSGLPEKTTDSGIGTEDWNNCTDQALFDLTGTVDQSYWNQTQWNQ